MNTRTDKTSENKSRAVAQSLSTQTGGKSTFQFADNDPEAIRQRKFQEMANNSPQVKQLRTYQEMADNKTEARQIAQLRLVINSGSSSPIQKQGIEEEEPIQQKKEKAMTQFPVGVLNQPPQDNLIQKKENNTGLPDTLKNGMESLSGMSLDDVKVHYHSDKPAQLQAYAYAQGTDIHIAAGQEKHLPHEAWHVVQQKQGRVKPTIQMKEDVVERTISQFINSRPEIITQRKLQGMSDNSTLTSYSKADNSSTKLNQDIPYNTTFLKSTTIQRNKNTKEGRKELNSEYRDTFGYSIFWRKESNKLLGALAVIEKIRNDFSLGDSNEYELRITKDFSEVGGAPKGGGQACTKGGSEDNGMKTIVYFGFSTVEECLTKGEVGNLISIMRHEYTHVKQHNNIRFKNRGFMNDTHVKEFEAYSQEIVDAAMNIKDGASPEEDHLWQSIQYANMHGGQLENRYGGIKDWGKAEPLRKRYLMIKNILDEVGNGKDAWGAVETVFGISNVKHVNNAETPASAEELEPLLKK